MTRPRPRVVIVGAGFGGLSAAKELAGVPVDVVVVDQHNFHTFQPLLYQVATAGLGADDVAHAVRGIFHRQDNVSFRMATVTGLDAAARQLLVADGAPLSYDLLVIAAGAATNTFGVPGVDEHAFALKSLPEALALRNHVLSQFEDAARDPSLADTGALTFVVIGGGPTGVELAGALRELISHVFARDFPDLDVSRARVVLVEATDHLLGQFSPGSRSYARGRLAAMGAEVRLTSAVASITPDGVHLTDGEFLATRTPIWVAGVRADPLADRLGLPQTRGGRIEVGRDLRVPGHPEVFVIGDMAAATDGDGNVLPQLAPVAIQAGKHVAHQIRRRLDGRPPTRFRYLDKGTMATIGRDAAVAELPLGIRFRGRLAWLAWLFLHLMYLVGFRNRVNVFVNWSYNYVTWDRGARLIVRGERLSE